VREIEEKQFLKLLVDQLASFHFLIELVGMSQLKVSSPKPQLNLAKNGGVTQADPARFVTTKHEIFLSHPHNSFPPGFRFCPLILLESQDRFLRTELLWVRKTDSPWVLLGKRFSLCLTKLIKRLNNVYHLQC
jgi:hypothetical protein